MEFREVRSLTVLGKLESIVKTAQEVNLTPAAVHKQIKNLENEFGVPLYEKTGRSVHLTQAAKVIMPYLDELLAQYEAITAALKEWKGLRRGFVRIGANPAISSFLVPALLHRFRETWPGITPILDVDISPVLAQRVASRSLDLAIGLWEDSERERLASQICWDFEVVFVTSARPKKRALRIRDLSGQPMVRLPQGTVLSGWIERYVAEHEFRPSQALVVNNAHTIISLIRAGLGIGMLPMWAVANEVQNGSLHVIRVQEPPLMGCCDLVTAPSTYLPPAVMALIEVARECSPPDLTLRPPKSGRTSH